MKHQRNANSARKPSPKGRRIQRRGVAERGQLLDRYERSGLSQKAFCQRHGVALSTLQYWRRCARDTDQAPTPIWVPSTAGGNSYGTGINAAGQVTGYSNDGANPSHAFVTNSGGQMIDLGTLHSGWGSIGLGINDFGQVTGSSWFGSDQHAFVTINGVMTDLNSLLDSRGSGWTLEVAQAINNSGQITGYGVNPQGQ